LNLESVTKGAGMDEFNQHQIGTKSTPFGKSVAILTASRVNLVSFWLSGS